MESKIWKYWERPRRIIMSKVHKFLGWDNAILIQREANKYRNQLMMDDFRVVRMLGWTDEHEEDYYWIIQTRQGVELHSCVGGFTPLKGKISKFNYERHLGIWDLNCSSIEEGLAQVKQSRWKLK